MRSQSKYKWHKEADSDDMDKSSGGKEPAEKASWLAGDQDYTDIQKRPGDCQGQPLPCCPPEAEKCLAHAYVLWQCYEQAFCPEEALAKGTLFPELFGVYRPPV